MHKVLFDFGAFKLFSYGAMLALGFVLALIWARKRAPSHSVSPDSIYDLAFWAMVPGILGARIVYIALNWDYYKDRPNELFSIQFSGLTSFGGVIFGGLGIWLWTRKSKLPILTILDVVGLPFLLAHAIGRIGCLLNGCCHGRPCSDWFCVPQGAAITHYFPAQLIDVALTIVSIGILLFVEKGMRLRIGQSFGIMIALYGVSRFIYEFWRAGTAAEFNAGIASAKYLPGLPITEAQAMALVLVLFGLALFFARKSATSAGEPIATA